MTEWSAPVDRWVRRARDRSDKILGAPARLLLDDLWSRADAPSKREPGPAFVYGVWVEFAELAREFDCDRRTILTQFSQLKSAGLARKGRGFDEGGRKVDGIWLADLPATGRFDEDQKIDKAGSNDPDSRIKTPGQMDDTIQPTGSNDPGPDDGQDQMIVNGGSNDHAKRIKPSTKTDQMIRPYKEDPIIPEQDPIIPEPRGAEPEQFELVPPGDVVTPGGITTAKISTWWAEVYQPARRRVFDRWRPDARIQPLDCTAKRVAEIRARLTASCPGLPWPDIRERLTHVVAVAEAKVAEQQGAIVPYGKGTYDTIRNIAPEYWLKATNFDNLLAAHAPAPRTARDDVTRGIEPWMRPRREAPLSDIGPEDR